MAVCGAEPDPLASRSRSPSPLLTRNALERPTFSASARRLFRTLLAFPARVSEAELARVAKHIEQRIPGGGAYVSVESHSEAQPALRNTLEKVQQYLGLVALLSLLVACVGISQIVASWLAQAAPQTAILRCLGLPAARRVRAVPRPRAVAGAARQPAFGAGLGASVPWLLAQSQPELIPASALQAALIWPLLRGVLLAWPRLLFSCRTRGPRSGRSRPQVSARGASPLPVPRSVRYAALLLAALGLFVAALCRRSSATRARLQRRRERLARAVVAGRARAHLVRRPLAPSVAVACAWPRSGAMARPPLATTGSVVALGMGTLVVMSTC